LAIVTIWAVATITFFLMNLVPGGPFLSEKAISPAATRALEAKYGLDKPLLERYLTYITDAARGDFGDSLKQRGRTVMDIIMMKFPVSAKVGGLAVIVSLCLGVPLGVLAAYKRGTAMDSIFSVVATCGIAVPSFVICTLLLYTFGVKLMWLPTLGLTSWKGYVMPVASLAAYPTSYIMRLMRSSMLDVLGQDYMRTARAKGLSEKISLFKHALRNAILPVITYVGPMIAYTLTGSFVVEKIFTIPGLGGEFIKAINGRDYTMIMGTTIFLASLMVVLNVIVDLVYKIVDPRIKLK
jgi:oligopeptide transport system permease protein